MLEEVLRCSNEISVITKFIQNFVRNQGSIFKTKIDKVTFEQRHQPLDNNKHKVSPNLPESNQPEVGTSKNEKYFYPSGDSTKADEDLELGIDLDQAFRRSARLKKRNAPNSTIVNKFDFLCVPKQGVDIKGLQPKLIEFSEDIDLTSDVAVISLALVLQHSIGKNETTTFLHIADEQPKILRRTIQLLRKLDETFSYTEDMEGYLQQNKKPKKIFANNFWRVNGMEFDHVVIVVTKSEYYLKCYLPQAISRCTYDLTFVLLPEDKKNTKNGSLQKLSKFISRIRNQKTKETVEIIIEEMKRESLVKQLVVAECKDCEKNCSCYSISNETHNKETFEVHTHSDQYQKHLENYAELEEQQPLNTNAGPHADAE